MTCKNVRKKEMNRILYLNYEKGWLPLNKHPNGKKNSGINYLQPFHHSRCSYIQLFIIILLFLRHDRPICTPFGRLAGRLSGS